MDVASRLPETDCTAVCHPSLSCCVFVGGGCREAASAGLPIPVQPLARGNSSSVAGGSGGANGNAGGNGRGSTGRKRGRPRASDAADADDEGEDGGYKGNQ